MLRHEPGFRQVTAPDPRLGEIEARLAAITKLGEWEMTRANDVVIYDPNGFGAYRKVAHADANWDAEFIAHSPGDIAYLLAELRDRDGKLARVEDLIGWLDAASADDEPMYAKGKVSARATADRLRAAVAAAKGDGE